MADSTSKNTLSLEDRLAIGELIARYCHCVDRGRWEDFPELFAAAVPLLGWEVPFILCGAQLALMGAVQGILLLR